MSKKDKDDLTRIEDLSEFLHSEDPDTDSQLESGEEDAIENFPPPFNPSESNEEVESSNSEDSTLPNFDSDNVSEFEASTEPSFDASAIDNFDSPDEDAFQNDDDDFSLNSTDEDTLGGFETSDSFSDNQFDQTDEAEFDSPPDFNIDQVEEDLNEDSDPFTFDEQAQDQEDFNEQHFEAQESEDPFDDQQQEDEALEDTDFPLAQDDSNTEFENQFEDDNELHAEAEEDSAEDSSSTELSVQGSKVIEPIEETAPPPITEDIQKPRETFNEVKNFANNLSYGKVSSGGSPAYSIIIKSIHAKDIDDILALLNQHGLMQEEPLARQSLELGQLLIPQISEYSAIYLATKLRKFCRDIQVGLAEEVHPSKSYEHDNRGMVTRSNLYQNKDFKFRTSENNFKVEDIITTTQSKVQNTDLVKHIGIVATSEVYALDELSAQTVNMESGEDDEITSNLEFHSKEIFTVLITRLKHKAFDIGANAVTGINFQTQPLSQEGEMKYQVTATGEACILQDEN